LASRFRILHKAIIADVTNVKSIIKATVALHNFLMKQKSINPLYCPDDYVDADDEHGLRLGKWRQTETELDSIGKQETNNYTRSAKTVRENYKNYFNSEVGAVPWQHKVLTSTSCHFDNEER